MSKITDIINKYTVGEATLEDTNTALAEMGADIHLEPGKHELTAEEAAEPVDVRLIQDLHLLGARVGNFFVHLNSSDAIVPETAGYLPLLRRNLSSPMTFCTGTQPITRLSDEWLRLSPMTQR